MHKVQKTYVLEFKREAVLLAQSSGKPIAKVARELGMRGHLSGFLLLHLFNESEIVLSNLCSRLELLVSQDFCPLMYQLVGMSVGFVEGVNGILKRRTGMQRAAFLFFAL